MKKVIQVHADGTQALVMGPANIRSNTKEIVQEYEVDVQEKKFKEMMEKPDKIKADKIPNKKRLK